MYKIFFLISTIIREFYLPNPFEKYFQNDLWYFKVDSIAEMFNLIIGGTILYYSSFFLASSIYRKGEMPSIIGSICYLISFIFNNILMEYLCSLFTNFKLEFIILIYFIIDLIVYLVIIKLKRIIQKNCFWILIKDIYFMCIKNYWGQSLQTQPLI